MATVTKCDLCEQEAVDTVEMKSKTTTPVKVDVCQEHLKKYKKMLHYFTKQEKEENAIAHI